MNGGNLRRTGFKPFQSQRQHSVNIGHQLNLILRIWQVKQK